MESIKNDNHPDLDKHICSECRKEIYVITISPPDDPNAIMLTTGLWVESHEGNSFVLCDECCEEYGDRLCYGGDGHSAYLI